MSVTFHRRCEEVQFGPNLMGNEAKRDTNISPPVRPPRQPEGGYGDIGDIFFNLPTYCISVASLKYMLESSSGATALLVIEQRSMVNETLNTKCPPPPPPSPPGLSACRAYR